jgi:hypothetical protein
MYIVAYFGGYLPTSIVLGIALDDAIVDGDYSRGELEVDSRRVNLGGNIQKVPKV